MISTLLVVGSISYVLVSTSGEEKIELLHRLKEIALENNKLDREFSEYVNREFLKGVMLKATIGENNE